MANVPERITGKLSSHVRQYVKAMEFLLHAIRQGEPITHDDHAAMDLYVRRLQDELNRLQLSSPLRSNATTERPSSAS